MGTSASGPPLNLTYPASGAKGWAAFMDATLSAINADIAALQAGGAAGAQGAQGPPGPVGMIFAGQWQSSTAYVSPNVVTYNGSSYIAIAASTNVQPDVSPNTWAPLALMGGVGAQGDQGLPGAQGPPGTPGANANITYPITVANGGTGAMDPADARTNLGAAASGINADITALQSITAGTTPQGQQGIAVTSPGGKGFALFASNGQGQSGGFTTDGGLYCEYILCAGNITAGNVIVSNLLQTGFLGEAVVGAGIICANRLALGSGILLQGTPPPAGTGQIGRGGTIASTASTTILGYEVVTLPGGVTGKIAILAS